MGSQAVWVLNEEESEMKYVVIENDVKKDFLEKVAEAIEKGWIPQGGVAVYYDSNLLKTWYAQAMVKNEA